MKKNLPNLFRGNISNGASNNKRVAHGLTEEVLSVKDTIDKLFKENKIYRKDVELEVNNNIMKTKIIGRTKEHVITIDNTVIKIEDITHIRILKEQDQNKI